MATKTSALALLLRQLNNTEMLIRGLLKTVTTPTSDESLIERKLTKLEDLLIQIPETERELLETWSSKWIALWQEYASGPPAVDKMSCSSPNSVLSGQSTIDIESPKKVLNMAGFNPADHPHLEKEDVVLMIERAFSGMSQIYSEKDALGLRRLLSAIIKACDIVQFYSNEPLFESDLIYRYIIRLLPPNRIITYLKRPQNEKVFSGLINELQNALLPETIPLSEIKNCYYCQREDHSIWQCPEILFCLRQKEGKKNVCKDSNENKKEMALINAELANLEASIKDLLSERPISLKLMQQQMTLLLKAISQIPEHFQTMHDAWSFRVSELMAQFSALAEPNVLEKRKKIETKKYSSLDRDYWNQVGSSLSRTPEKKKEINQVRMINKQKHQQQQNSPLRDVIVSKLRAAFDRFNDVSGGLPLRRLFVLTAKAFKLTKPLHPTDTAFGEAIFELAFSKLAPSLSGKFNQSSDTSNMKNRKLFDLCTFLSQVVLFEEEKADMSKESQVPSTFCNFCRKKGHRANNCPKIINRLCYSCFEKGHDWKRCPNVALTSQELLNSL